MMAAEQPVTARTTAGVRLGSRSANPIRAIAMRVPEGGAGAGRKILAAAEVTGEAGLSEHGTKHAIRRLK